MEKEYIIAIPSKGRCDKVKSKKFFTNKYKVYLFVEPQEIELYKKHNNDCIIIDILKNNMGISYVRNFILTFFKKPFLMLDDDIKEFYYRDENLKLHKLQDIEILLNTVYDYFNKGYKQVGLSFKASNWMFDKTFKENSRVWCFNGLNPIQGIKFDNLVGSFEDYDYTIQLLYNGYNNIVLYNFVFDCEKMGNFPGGFQDLDRKSISKKSREYLYEKWGYDILKDKFNESTGIMEVQVLWSKIKVKRKKDELSLF